MYELEDARSLSATLIFSQLLAPQSTETSSYQFDRLIKHLLLEADGKVASQNITGRLILNPRLEGPETEVLYRLPLWHGKCRNLSFEASSWVLTNAFCWVVDLLLYHAQVSQEVARHFPE